MGEGDFLLVAKQGRIFLMSACESNSGLVYV